MRLNPVEFDKAHNGNQRPGSLQHYKRPIDNQDRSVTGKTCTNNIHHIKENPFFRNEIENDEEISKESNEYANESDDIVVSHDPNLKRKSRHSATD
jgi:hypothetical protein